MRYFYKLLCQSSKCIFPENSMTEQRQKNIETSQDVRVATTTRIWGITVGILAMCIPLSALTRSGPIIPLVAIGSTTAATFAVWRSDGKKSQSYYLQSEHIELLEQRIADLETIVSSDDFDLSGKIRQLETRNIHRKNSGMRPQPIQITHKTRN